MAAKRSNMTVRILSLLVVILYTFLTFSAFKILPTGWALTTTLGSALLLFVGAGVLYAETYLEGKKPNLAKDKFALVNVIFSGILVIFGIVVLIGQITISGPLSGLLGTILGITTVLIAREVLTNV